jgi:hypothetical protein
MSTPVKKPLTGLFQPSPPSTGIRLNSYPLTDPATIMLSTSNPEKLFQLGPFIRCPETSY